MSPYEDCPAAISGMTAVIALGQSGLKRWVEKSTIVILLIFTCMHLSGRAFCNSTLLLIPSSYYESFL